MPKHPSQKRLKPRRGVASAFVGRLLEDGRGGFSLDELVSETRLSTEAARRQLGRLNAVVPLYGRATFYLIVQPEHRRIGAPPVDWWIDDFFTWLKQPYYIGLLSAAAIHGSSPQAIQVTQVVVAEPRAPIRIGRLAIQFITKKHAKETPTAVPRGARNPVKVSTPEATFLDLVLHVQRLGGLPRILDVIEALPLTAEGMRDAMTQKLETKLLQRAGFILELLEKPRLARLVAGRLEGRRLQPAPIAGSSDDDSPSIQPNPWYVTGTIGARSGS
jgi:predicted transcriptional regulator of viral defense system